MKADERIIPSVEGDGVFKLTIKDALPEDDSASYTCKLKNLAGEAETSADVNVESEFHVFSKTVALYDM